MPELRRGRILRQSAGRGRKVEYRAAELLQLRRGEDGRGDGIEYAVVLRKAALIAARADRRIYKYEVSDEARDGSSNE